jgi:type II pantothenate kinase
LDVGGTLAKLVYFEQRQNENQPEISRRKQFLHRRASAQVILEARRGHDSPLLLGPNSTELPNGSRRRRHSTAELPTDHLHTIDSDRDLRQMYLLRQESMPEDTTEFEEFLPWKEPTAHESLAGSMNGNKKDGAEKKEASPMKKSRSMLDFSESRDHAEALDRFYNFARRLDVYETAVKDKNLSFYSRELGGDFHFIRFETRRMENAMDLIRINDLHKNIAQMGATGGGAHKYAADWERVLGIKMEKQDELDSLVAGMQFVLSTAIGECYTYRPRLQHEESSCPSDDINPVTEKTAAQNEANADLQSSDNGDMNDPQYHKAREVRYQGDEWWWSRKVQRDVASHSSTYPYMLVTLGTGVSVLRVDGPRKHERVSGSTIGGGTYWGLIRLLTDVEGFEDVIKLAERGDPSKVDMMVGDIYGKNSDALDKIGLPSNLVASSFGKLVAKNDPAAGVKQEDLARALLLMVTNNIGQVAYLNAKLHKTHRIYFAGNFLRHNQISQQRLAYAIDYWSKGEMEALFLEHEGYFGALGAFLLSQGISSDECGSFNGRRPNPARVSSSDNAEFGGSNHRRTKTMSDLKHESS